MSPILRTRFSPSSTCSPFWYLDIYSFSTLVDFALYFIRSGPELLVVPSLYSKFSPLSKIFLECASSIAECFRDGSWKLIDSSGFD